MTTNQNVPEADPGDTQGQVFRSGVDTEQTEAEGADTEAHRWALDAEQIEGDDDTAGHSMRGGAEVDRAEGDEDTEGHKHFAAAADRAEGDEDTEGHKHFAAAADWAEGDEDTEGHKHFAAAAERTEDDEDTEGHRWAANAEQTEGYDDTEGHMQRFMDIEERAVTGHAVGARSAAEFPRRQGTDVSESGGINTEVGIAPNAISP